MAAFIWDSTFLTGLKEVDEQHFYLVGLINKFGRLLVDNDVSEENIEIVFQELYEYTRYHFQEEEALMQNASVDPRFVSEHIKIHQEFLSQLISLHNDISVDDLNSLRALLDFLIHWLAYHILGIDQCTAEQITAIKNGSTKEQAFEAASIKAHNATEPLINALKNLFQQVSERNKELQQLNKKLETKVAHRTQELQEANQHLEQLAVTDALTNLPNRRFALSHLATLWERTKQNQQPLSCLMIDADYFKAVNDKYGHAAGDTVLVRLSQRLQQSLRNDDIICRLGGDEFLVICENTDCSGAQHLAQLLCAEIANLIVETGSGSWLGSISIGVASKDEKTLKMEDLIKMADQGVYLAKEAGKGCVRKTCGD